MELKKGDIFCTHNPMWIGRAICSVQKWWDPDDEAEFSHTGVIVCERLGNTFEALWINGRGNLFSRYAGKRVLIGRYDKMDMAGFMIGWQQVYQLEGRFYAGHRLLLHLVPPLAKRFASGRFAVCSEIVAKFLCGVGAMTVWSGITPDYIADMIQRYRGWQVVFDGILPASLEEFGKL